MFRISYRQLFSTLLLFNLLFSTFDAIGQTRRAAKPTAVPSKSESKPICNGGWSGVVTYSKTLKDSLESDEPGIRKNTDRIKHKTSRDYDYIARSVIDGSDPRNPVVTSKVSFDDKDLSWGQEKVFDTCNSRENGHWFIIEGTDDRQSQAQAQGPARSFNLSVDELSGMYSFNLQLPDANGAFKREEHVKRTGHCQPKNNEPYDRSTNEPLTVKGESFSISGEKMDRDDPDHISGTKVWGDDGKGEVRSFIYQVTWRFTRCPQKLLITELKFEHPKYPDPDAWKEIPEVLGTIDGNRIKVTAKVLNMSGEEKYADLKIAETYKGDKYNGARPDEPLPEGETSFRLEAGEERSIEFIWDSEGQAWFDDGRPHLLHRIKAELAENGQKRDQKEKPLNIAPKPLILVRGVWSSYKIWEPLYQNLLTANHSYQWKAYLVGEKPEYGKLNMGGQMWSGQTASSVYENADRLAKYVRFAQEDSNAWHVDMVAHSTGGLVARLYMHKLMPNVPDARPLVKHLMMLGTPNGGVPCVDVFAGKLDVFKEQLQAVEELTNEEMLRFNQYVVNTGGTKYSALVGNSVPIICGGFEWNDGFVTVRSAKYGVDDFAYSNDLNLQLVDGKNFGNFVKPHVITGPKGLYPLPVKSDPNDIDRWKVNGLMINEGPDAFAGAFFTNASFGQVIADGTSIETKLAAGETRDVDLAVAAGPNLGVTFLADPSVTVSLVDAGGVVVRRNTAGSELAGTIFRMLYFNKPVQSGTWKVRLENTSRTEQAFAGFSWYIGTGGKLPVAE